MKDENPAKNVALQEKGMVIRYEDNQFATCRWDAISQISLINRNEKQYWYIEFGKNYCLVPMGCDGEQMLAHRFQLWAKFNYDGYIKWLNEKDSKDTTLFVA